MQYEVIRITADDLPISEYIPFSQSIVTGMTLYLHREIYPINPHKINSIDLIFNFEQLEERRYLNMLKRNYSIDRMALNSWEHFRSTIWMYDNIGDIN